jgi:hypothetical protein
MVATGDLLKNYVRVVGIWKPTIAMCDDPLDLPQPVSRPVVEARTTSLGANAMGHCTLNNPYLRRQSGRVDAGAYVLTMAFGTRLSPL